MTTRTRNTTIGCAAILALMTQVAPAGTFAYLLPADSYQSVWSGTQYWSLTGGVDDGANGYPDGTDTFTMDRTSNNGNPTRLTEEGSGVTSSAGFTGTGGGGSPDIVLKLSNFTIGDMNILPSANAFQIFAERDKSILIDGVVSGAGDLLLTRNGGFSDGVTSDEIISLTGTMANTITGNIRLYNSNATQPGFWVGDKVGAFGQAAELRLEGNAGAAGASELRITTNAIGGEGAIDDDATSVFIGAQGVLNVDSGVNELIGLGNLSIDLTGSGTFATVDPGTYDNTVAWITGDGTVTVIPEPSSFALLALGLLGLMRRKR